MQASLRTKDAERPSEEPQPLSPPGPSTAQAAAASGPAPADMLPLDVQAMIDERVKALEAQNSAVNIRTREAAKQLRRKVRDADKLAADKSKEPAAVIKALHAAAVEALNAQIQANKRAAEAETAKDTAAGLLATKDKELQQARGLVAKLQELCRELHKQNKEVVGASAASREAEEDRRRAAVDDMSAKLAGITERINGQQGVMDAQAAENARLRAQLASMGDVVRLSEEVKAGYDGEVARLRSDLTKQLELGKAAAEGLAAERERADGYMAQLLEQQGGVKKLLASHKETHAALSKSTALNKELSERCASLKGEYGKSAAMLLERVGECRAKDAQLQKLALANERLQGLCRALRGGAAAGGGEGEAAPAASADSDGTEAAMPVA